MKRARAPIAVLTADVVGSSRYSSTDRRKLDEVIRKAFAEVEHRFPDAIHTRLAFRITAGDEFQCVISDTPRVLDILTYFRAVVAASGLRSEEHTSELQSRLHLVCRLLLEKKKKKNYAIRVCI